MNPAATEGSGLTGRAVYIDGAPYRRRAYGANHPLAIPRVSLTTALLHAYGALTPTEIVSARKAADVELAWFHTSAYIAAFKRAEAVGRVTQAVRERHRLGTLENPYFDQFFTIPATATGASIQAAEQVLAGKIAFNPAGGMHHARPDCAQGFCFFNDVVLAIQRLRRENLRVLYVDLDAHHGDGVEAAFAGDEQVFTLSLHMDTAYAYPFVGGRLQDTVTGFTSMNIPLPKDTNDAEYHLLFDTVWAPLLAKFCPDAIVMQTGTDVIFADPLGKLQMTTQGFLAVVARIVDSAPRHADGTPCLLATGGGGYHPLVLARAWAGVWAVLSGRELPAAMPAAGEKLLRDVGWDLDEDAPYFEQLFASRLDAAEQQPVRDDVVRLAEALLYHPYIEIAS